VARMIPPYLADDIKSTGERYIFDLLKHDPGTSDWTVIHSLGLKRHVRKHEGEIDFVVLAPGLGVFCLEVKSGRVSVRDGVWEFTNRYNEVITKVRGPFEQAREAMYSLRQQVVEKFGESHRLSRILFGYGVVFPHTTFQTDSVEHERWRIYDKDSRKRPISEYIRSLAANTVEKMKIYSWFREEDAKPSKRDVETLVSFMRGNFERFASRQAINEDIEYFLNKFTEEQCACLDHLEYNPRCVFVGAAGTGKTVLAVEAAKRALSQGLRTIVLSFNTLLGSQIRCQLQDVKGPLLYAGSFHQFLTKISNLPSGEVANSDEFFTYTLPLAALEAVDAGQVELADILIVDEGQDLITPEYLDVMDSLLVGGLSGGRWYLFCDFERQAIYSNLSQDEMISLLHGRATFAVFKLTTNCRNSKAIVQETSLICRTELPRTLDNVQGVPVQYFFYRNDEEQIRQITTIIRELKQGGVHSSGIVVLSPNRLENSCMRMMRDYKVVELDAETLNSTSSNNEIRFSTIHAFKGLECSNVILCDIRRFDTQKYRQLLYVGMSRARVGLYVLAHHDSREYYEFLLKEGLKL
jgi:hypothetical protein